MKCFVLFALSVRSHVLRVLPCLFARLLIVCVYFTSEGFKTVGKCIFSKLWLQKSLYKEWLREVKGNKHKARCIVCMKDVDILSMGESALTSHFKGKRFLKLINYSCSSYPTRASYSGQVDGFRNPIKTELKTRPCLKAVFQII